MVTLLKSKKRNDDQSDMTGLSYFTEGTEASRKMPPKRRSFLFNSRSRSKSDDEFRTDADEDRDEMDGTPRRTGSGSKGRKALQRALSWENENENVAAVYDKFGENAAEVMTIKRYGAMPLPNSPTDVVVKIKASTVSLNDVTIRRGMWYESVSLPATPGFECVGVIAKLGDRVKESGEFQEGDKVAALLRTGGNARYASIPASRLVKVPKGVSFENAVCVVGTFMTAYQALYRARPLKEKDTLEGTSILVTGGNGPVGQAVIELALRAGAKEVYATALDQHHRLLAAAGAKPLPMDEEEWLPMVEGKMDLVIDSVCQDDYDSPQRALKSNGHLVVTGMTAIMVREEPGWFGRPSDAVWASFKAKYLMGSTSCYEIWESCNRKPEEFKHDLEYLFGLLQRGKIKPKIAERIAVSEVPGAHVRIQNGGVKSGGVIVCKPWGS